VVDSAFASVKLLVALFSLFGMAMMGAVKTASKGFPKKWLNDYHAYGTERNAAGQQRLPRGHWVTLESKYTTPNSSVERVMYAIGWLDKKLKAVLCNCGTTLQAVTDSIRRRHRKVVVNGEFVTESIDLAIPRPQAIMDFFEAFSKIDVHDHIRQGILEMERFWMTKHWYLRIFQTVFAVTVVNSYLGFRWESIRSGVAEDTIIGFEDFAGRLAYQMINNVYLEENGGIRTRASSPFVAASSPVLPNTREQVAATNHVVVRLSDDNMGKKKCRLCKQNGNPNKVCSYYCKTCSNNGMIYGICSFESKTKCAHIHLTNS
jgi:hypothetical protein